MYQSNTIGVAYIPWTFPTATVLDEIHFSNPPDEWTLKKVQAMYDWYVDAVQKNGLPTYGPGAKKTVEYVSEKTGYPIGQVRLFFLTLYKLTGSGKINPKYLNQVKPEGKNLELPWLDKTQKILKWGGITVVSVTVLYFSWPLIKKSFSKRRG